MTFRAALGLVVLLASPGCAEDEAAFEVSHAKDFSSAGTTVSVFGVFKDGRMSTESWDLLGSRLTEPLQNRAGCKAGYSTELVTGNAPLADAIDEYARANGITDELLDRLAPAAKGDAIMVVSVAGRPPHALGDAGAPPPRAPVRVGRGARSPGTGTVNGGRRAAPMDDSVFQVAVSIFSLKLHRSVAMVSMTYAGQSVDTALTRFTEKLRAAYPGVACAGWSWDANVDADAIRKSMQE